MALTVAELIAKVSADTGNFESGMSRVRGSLASAHGQVGKTESGFASFARTAAAFVAGQVIYRGMQMAVQGLKQFGSEVILTKARVDEMTIVLQNLARVNGISMSTVDQQVNGMRKLHIEYGVAQNTVAQMIRSQIDLSKATELARVAQDAAVISGQNSSDVLQQIIYGITTRQTEMLRTAGIQVNIDAAERQYAESLGITVKEMTEQQKTQATLNAVLAEGAKYQGTYETAMQSAGKQMRSIKTDMNDLMVTMGGPFQQGFGLVIKTVRDVIGGTNEAFGPGGEFETILAGMGAAFTGFGNAFKGSFGDIIGALMPVIGNLTEHLLQVGGALVEALAPAFQILGPIINEFIDALAGILMPLKPLIPVIAGMAGYVVEFFTDIMVAARPVVEALVPIAKLVGETLVNAFHALEPALNESLKVLGGAFADVIKALAPALPPLAKAVVDVVKAFSPVLVVVAKAFAEHLRAIAPQLPGLVKGFTDILIAITPLLPDLIKLVSLALLPLKLYSKEVSIYVALLAVYLRGLATALRFVVGVIKDVPGWFMAAYEAVKNFFLAIPGAVGTALSAMGSFFGSIGSWFASLGPTILNALTTFFTQMIPMGAKVLGNFLLGLLQALPGVLLFFVSLPFRLIGFLGIMLPLMIAKGVMTLTGFLVGLITKLPEVAAWFISLFPKVLAWIGNTAVWLVQKGWQLLQGLWNGIVQGAIAVWNFFASLPGRIAAFFVAAGRWLLGAGTAIFNGLKDGMIAGWDAVWNYLSSIPGAVKSWFMDAASWLYNAGKQVIEGLKNGIEDAAGAVAGFFKGIGKKIKGWILDPFGLGSPSRVMYAAGRDIMAGLQLGLTHGNNTLMRDLRTMVPTITANLVPTMPTVTPGLGGGVGVGGMPTTNNVYVTVQGSVLSERELGDVVNEQLFRLQRNAVATPWGRTA